MADFFIPHAGFLDHGEVPVSGSSMREKMSSLAGMVDGCLIVTHGEHGACYFDKGTLVQVPVPRVRVKDTTGAGDNFHGAFTLALSRGFDLADAARFSVAVASLSCRDYGGRAGVPDFQEALEVMRSLHSMSI